VNHPRTKPPSSYAHPSSHPKIGEFLPVTGTDRTMLEEVFGELIEAREKLDAARRVLQAALDVPDADTESLRVAASRLERMAAEVARIEEEYLEQSLSFA
jgi:hypothetical protein